MTAKYFTSTDYNPPALLRRKDWVDEAFVHGVWRPTSSIMDAIAGHDDSVEDITEAEAKVFAPEAFI